MNDKKPEDSAVDPAATFKEGEEPSNESIKPVEILSREIDHETGLVTVEFSNGANIVFNADGASSALALTDTSIPREGFIEDPTPNLLARAISDMPDEAKKDSYNKYDDFWYASADSIYVAARKALAKHGITIWMEEISIEIEQHGTTGNDKKPFFMIHAVYEIGFQYGQRRPAAEDCETVTMFEQFRSGKSFGAIRTYTEKYWLRGKVMLGTGDQSEDPDSSKNEAGSAPKSPPKNQRQSTRRAPATAKAAPAARASNMKAAWAFRGDSHKYEVEGEFADALTSGRALMSALLRDFSVRELNDIEIKWRSKTLDANKDVINGMLPEAGRKMLKDMLKKQGTILATAANTIKD